VHIIVERFEPLTPWSLMNVLPMMPASSFFCAKALAVRIATVTKAAIESRFEDIFPPGQVELFDYGSG
jgi:hypothetical protein